MTTKAIRFAATAGAAVILGLTGVAAGATSAVAAPSTTTTASASSASGYEFKGWYSSQQQCKGGGDIYLRHGYSSYYCVLDPTRGWALWVQ
ncbi:hypothetical protein [Embleya sp. NBC_00896]|uniref:hypothetical protein n=1 Tax=Embleya sp. NBC_00896 TaxID=2975961 RepID=UPI002F90FEEB|nr:hypothetical protein OG928_38855 [Embleya sp. NBC_00896]